MIVHNPVHAAVFPEFLPIPQFQIEESLSLIHISLTIAGNWRSRKMIKVVKFGGSSLASAEQFAKVGKIIQADKERRYVVPSAPGKRNAKDTKVTDMLYACYALVEAEEDFRVPLMKIKDRYDTIINGLNLKLSLEEEFKKISENFKNKAGVDYAASRGEYLNVIIMANYLGYELSLIHILHLSTSRVLCMRQICRRSKGKVVEIVDTQ